MIRRLVLRRFKRFDEVVLELPGHVVLAGPNNTGKTTLLQAIATWDLGFTRWKQLGDWRRHGGGYTKAPLSRLAFSAVPLRAFDLLFFDRQYEGAVEIEITSQSGWKAAIELHAESTEQVYVRPRRDVTPEVLRGIDLRTVFVPPMSGLGTAEPVYQAPKVDQLLGQGKPGDVLRNLLLVARENEAAWDALKASMERLFAIELLPPDGSGPDILAEYRTSHDRKPLDIASAGSGLQQVLMLLTFLHTRPGSVLLLDEPDAHLHVILKDAIYGELKAVAATQGSQLILATHSEVILDAADVEEVMVVFAKPRPLAGDAEREALSTALAVLSHTQVMKAGEAPGILYLEDYTDLEILRAFARVLGHPALETLTTRLFWEKTVATARAGGPGTRSREHYAALQVVRPGLPGLELIDGDARGDVPGTPITGSGLQRLRWRRYEIESYLFHPAALARFVASTVGRGSAPAAIEALEKHLKENHPPGFLKDPLQDHAFLRGVKARTDLLPPALSAAGLPGFPYTRYHEIAAQMRSEEIHPDVVEALGAIQRAFGLC